jgi:hypothetical protein
MIYTPYFNADPKLENPILCYGISENGRVPVYWKNHSLIRDTPEFGYNSDPSIYFDGNRLVVFWRENLTPRTNSDKLIRATYGTILDEYHNIEIETPLLIEKSIDVDRQLSPTILKFNGLYRAYSSHFRLKIDKLHPKNKALDKVVCSIFRILSSLEFFQEMKSLGVAIWESTSLQQPFTYIKTVKIQNSNKLYQPWHFDFFEYGNKLYILIQSNQFNADICLGVSDDYENFRIYEKPLLTLQDIGKVGFYKPTGVVYNDVLYLYYTAQDTDNRGKNKLYSTSYPMKKLLEKISS